MIRYYRYRVKLIDGGKCILIDARNSDGDTLDGEPKADCALSGIPERITELGRKVKNGTANHEEMHELGEALFCALLSAEVRTELRGLVAKLGKDELLRIELDLGEDTLPEVAALPWEFLRAPETLGHAVGDWGTSKRVILSRRRDLHEPAPTIALDEPLRIQLVVAAPNDLGPVEYKPVETALKELAKKNPKLIAPPLKTLLQPDATQLDRVLEDNKPHIVHIIGHGRMRTLRKMPVAELGLVSASGNADWRTDEEIGDILGAHHIGVVVLQACESGAIGSAEAFTGVASQIVQQNVPVVIAMQYPISNNVAITFSEEFYRRLGKMEPVDFAVQMARRVLSQQYKDTRDYAAPVLFMRVKDGQLFTRQNAVSPESVPISIPPPEVGRVDLLAPFPTDWIETLPHPLAAACAKFNAAGSDSERFEMLDRLLVNLIKYLNAIALSLYWQDNPDQNQLREWLSGLVESQLMTVQNILNQVADHYATARLKPPLYSILFQPYADLVGESSPIARACHHLRRITPGERGRIEEITPRTFLARWLAVRENKWESHPSELLATIRDALLPYLRLAMEDLIGVFRNLWNYPLLFIERVDPDGQEWKYTMVAFPGASGEPKIEEPLCESKSDTPNYKRDSLYLCSPDRTYLLNLHPFFIAHLHRLYFLERGAAKKQIWYRHCATGEPYHPPEYYKFLSQRWSEETKRADKEQDPVEEIKQANDALQKEESEHYAEGLPFSILMAHLDDDAQRAIYIALGESLRIGHFWLGVEFLLMGLSKVENGILPQLLEQIGVEPGDFRGLLRGLTDVRTKDWREERDVEALGKRAITELKEIDVATLQKLYRTNDMPIVVITPRMMIVLRNAIHMVGSDKIGQAHLLFAALQFSQSPAIQFLFALTEKSGRDPRELRKWVQQYLRVPSDVAEAKPGPVEGTEKPPIAGETPLPPQPRLVQKPLPVIKGILGRLGRDLTALAQAGELHPAIGENAHKAMLQIGTILQQTQANNPILLGDPGVGKTAIVEGFAWRLAVGANHKQPVVPQLANKRVVDLSPTAILAGSKYRGDLEERLQKILAEVREADGQTIVFIDEIHTILGGGAEGGIGAISDALKPALARAEFPCIGATTVAEYRRYIEADAALARRFTPVWIEEPSTKDAIEICQAVVKNVLTPSHHVNYSPEVIEEAVRLAIRYIHDEFLPGKAIKILDQAGPRIIMGSSLRGVVNQDTTIAGIVTIATVRAIVAERTGIPLTRLSQDESTRLLQLEPELKKRVKGQDEAISQIVRVVKRARAGIADPRRPLGVFLFAGPTGVGKTELALAVAEALFDEEDAILRFDMSEFMEKHQVARLIGSPPGYIGHEEEGQLTGRLRRRPYSVVLFDEIEKAHPDVQHLFLQLFDAGRITDSHGNSAYGRNAIFIMTTNLGAKEAMGFIAKNEPYQAPFQAAIENYFTAEFLNRIDRIVYFSPLSDKTVLAIFDKLFMRIQERFKEQGITVEITESFKRDLCNRHTDKTRGARLLARAIEDEIVTPLTDKLLANEIKPGTTVVFGEGMPTSKENHSMGFALPQVPKPSLKDKLHEPEMDDLAGVPELDLREIRNRETLTPLIEALCLGLSQQNIELTIDEHALELLCSPFGDKARGQRDATTAFKQLVEEPLLAKIQTGEFALGDRIEVYRNLSAEIDFRKLPEDKK